MKGKVEKKTDKHRSKVKKIFYFGKKNKDKLFTLLLECIKNDMYQSQIAKYLSKKMGKKVTKQRVFYWISCLIKRGLVRKEHHKPILTDKGKKFLIHHENPPNYSGHAFEVSYDLKDAGELPGNNVKLKNWGYWKERFYNIFIRVNRGKRNKLVIYVPEIKSETKHDLLIKIGEKLGMILYLIERQYSCKVDWGTRQIVRRLEVHAPNDPEGKIFEREKINYKGKTIDINQSGDAHFDITEGNKKLEPFEAIERYDQMINDFPSIKNMIGGIAQANTQTFNLMAMQTESIKQVKNAILGILELLRANPKESQENALDNKERIQIPVSSEGLNQFFKPSEEKTIRIETLETIPSFVADRKGVLTEYPELNKGARIWLPKSVAEALIRKGKAKKK